jgi:precorrin-4 methylase
MINITQVPDDADAGSARRGQPLLAFRSSLHSVDDIVNALIPFYGPHCRTSAIFHDSLSAETRIDATLETIAGALINYATNRRPVLVIG